MALTDRFPSSDELEDFGVNGGAGVSGGRGTSAGCFWADGEPSVGLVFWRFNGLGGAMSPTLKNPVRQLSASSSYDTMRSR